MKLDIRKIMVPVDFSETSAHALEYAGWLAGTTHADLLLVHVLPPDPYYFETVDPLLIPEDRDETRNFTEEKLRDLSRHCSDKFGVNPRYRILRGKISDSLIDLVDEENIDIIMMGTHGATGLEEILLGSNAQHLVERAPCPVISFQNEKRKPGFSNIVLPVERARHSREKVNVAISLARKCNSRIHILGLLEDESKGEYEKLQIVLDQVQTVIEHADISYTRHTVKGVNIANEALKYADRIDADLIMILAEDESIMGRFDLGRFSRHIVNHSPIPVMSVNPHYGKFESLDITGAYSAY